MTHDNCFARVIRTFLTRAGIVAVVVSGLLSIVGCRDEFTSAYSTITIQQHDTTNICKCNWAVASTGSTETLFAFSAPDSNHFFVSGTNGLVQHSTNGGATWISMNSPSRTDLYGCAFISPTEGWVGGGTLSQFDGNLYHTTDAGVSWVSDLLDSTQFIRRVYFQSPIQGYIVTDFDSSSHNMGEVFRTLDGGKTWVKIFTSYLNIQGIAFADSLHGFVGQRRGETLVTTDGGTTWFGGETCGADFMTSVAFVPSNPMLGFEASYNDATIGAVTKTTDGGRTWRISANESLGVYAVAASTHAVVAGCAGGNVMESLDFGITWTLNSISTRTIFDARFVSPSKCVMVGESGLVAIKSF